MDLTVDEVKLIRDTFALINLISKTVAKQFYQCLFTLEPTLRGHFPADLTLQQLHLMATLQLLVDSLDQPDLFPQAVLRLATEHRPLQADGFARFGEALLSTLQLALGRAWTPEVHGAWAKAYAGVMAEIITNVIEAT